MPFQVRCVTCKFVGPYNSHTRWEDLCQAHFTLDDQCFFKFIDYWTCSDEELSYIGSNKCLADASREQMMVSLYLASIHTRKMREEMCRFFSFHRKTDWPKYLNIITCAELGLFWHPPTRYPRLKCVHCGVVILAKNPFEGPEKLWMRHYMCWSE